MNTDMLWAVSSSKVGILESPREASGKDWPNVGASGPAGQSSGANQLVKQTTEQEGPMHTQDSGDRTPSVWGKADFPVGKSKGEGGMASTSVSIKGSIDWRRVRCRPTRRNKRTKSPLSGQLIGT